MTPEQRERFESLIDRSGGPDACHPWLGYRFAEGYGGLRISGRRYVASRVAFYLAHGRWPVECACHRCDNRPCCNDRHLFEGTRADNNRDRDAKGRRGILGERHADAKLTVAKVRSIRREYAAGGVSQQAIADRHGVLQTTVSRIVLNRIWRHALEIG